MKDLVYELRALTRRHREGSYSTQANRWAMLRQMGEQLLAAGYNQLHVYDLKGRHLHTLLKQWQADKLSAATQKNRMAVLRWWAEKIGKGDMFKPTNTAYGIARRQTIPAVSKARTLPGEKLSRISSPYVRMSLELQRAFGLRRQEAIKIRPHQADQGTHLVLQGSWCKGGHGRSIPITTPAQREVLDRAKALVRFQEASLIPKGKTYKSQVALYEKQCRRANLDSMHGLRHGYAQARFLDLAGFLAPAAGGPTQARLTAEQQALDADARAAISVEMGHYREQITATYLGR